jgi:peptidoglycan hydrolase-like protein with peptidoglycan-binding domain
MKAKVLVVVLALPLLFACQRQKNLAKDASQSDSSPAVSSSEATNPATALDESGNPTSGQRDSGLGAIDQGRLGSGPTYTGPQVANPGATSAGVLTAATFVQAQKALGDHGYVVNTGTNGGPETTRSIRQFQADRGLTVTGSFDAQTLRLLGVTPTTDRLPSSLPQEDTN